MYGPGLRPKEVTNRLQHFDSIADYLEGRDHGHREQGSGDAPHPIPEDQRYDHDHGVECELPRQQHGSNRLPFGEMDQQENAGRQQRRPRFFESSQPNQGQKEGAGQRAEDGNVVQQERSTPPKNGIVQPAEIGSNSRKDADRYIHHGYRAEVDRDRALDLVDDFDRLFFVVKRRQYLDDPPQE